MALQDHKKNESSEMKPQPLCTVNEIAKYLNYSAWTIRQLVKDEKIPYLRLPNGALRFRKEVIDRWIAQFERGDRAWVYTDVPEAPIGRSGTPMAEEPKSQADEKARGRTKSQH